MNWINFNGDEFECKVRMGYDRFNEWNCEKLKW